MKPEVLSLAAWPRPPLSLSAKLSVLALCVAPGSLWAAEAGATALNHVQLSGYVVKMLVSMAVVLGLLAGFAWYARRYGLGAYPRKPNDQLRVVSMLSLGARERLVIVQAGRQQILLGLTQGNIKKLHLLSPEPDITPEATTFDRALAEQMDALPHSEREEKDNE